MDDTFLNREAGVRLARQAGASISCAESCTGGLVAAALTDVPGASDVFVGGVVAYSNVLKTQILGVPDGLLERFGAVSQETAAAMTDGVRRLADTTHAVSVTGIAGPGGGLPDKPVGLVWFGLAAPNGVSVSTRTFMGDRAGVRARATVTALDLLRRALAGL